jgi:chromosome segregation ATPase
VELNEVRLGDKPEVLVLYDFTERLAGLRRDYGRRLAPLRPQIREIERTLTLAKADAAGTAEKLRMVQEVLGQEANQAQKTYEDYRTSVSKLWLEEAGLLDNEFDEKRRGFLDEVEDRARALGLFYHPDEDKDLQQPEIAANEFRLALYRAPPSIKLPEQFGWVEKKLREWHDFEKDWNNRYRGLGTRAKQLRSPAATSLDQKQEQVKIQEQELNKFRGDAQMIQKEIQDYEARLRELKEREAQAKGPFEEDVNAIPDAFLCVRVPLDADAAPIVVQGKVAQAAPGTLQIVVRGRKNNQPAWVIRPLEPVAHKKTELIFRDEDFQPVSDWLETD